MEYTEHSEEYTESFECESVVSSVRSVLSVREKLQDRRAGASLKLGPDIIQ